MEAQYYTRRNLIAAFVVGLLVGLGVYYLGSHMAVFSGDNEPREENHEMMGTDTPMDAGDSTDNNTDDTGGASGTMPATYEASVSDQPAGLRVVLDSVTAPSNTWVAVREDANGTMGNILGASRIITGGTERDKEVPLLRNTEEGKTYHVVFYEDDGDESFDHNTDTLVETPAGVVSESFTAMRVN